MWSIHDDKEYQRAAKVYFQDKLLAATVLRLIPPSVKPNHLTMLRFLATPAVIWLMFTENYQIGLWAFLAVALTDGLDGALARTRAQVTDWGKIYDPLADKLLIGSMVFIIVLRYIDFWAAMVIIGVEVAIIASAWWWKHNGHPVQANVWGKIKMVLQVLGVVLLLLGVVFDWEKLLPFSEGVFYLAIAFAIISLLTYGF